MFLCLNEIYYIDDLLYFHRILSKSRNKIKRTCKKRLGSASSICSIVRLDALESTLTGSIASHAKCLAYISWAIAHRNSWSVVEWYRSHAVQKYKFSALNSFFKNSYLNNQTNVYVYDFVNIQRIIFICSSRRYSYRYFYYY